MNKTRVLFCFSHLRWDFVYQRPQHLMTWANEEYNIFFFEEPLFTEDKFPVLSIRNGPSGIIIVTPKIPITTEESKIGFIYKELFNNFCNESNLRADVLWYYTPMALSFTDHLATGLVIYDCMDELSLFKNPPAGLTDFENQLLATADLVFTGGLSLYEAKRKRHPHVHAFPSSVDVSHFSTARLLRKKRATEPSDYPTLGYIGVIDERLNIALLSELAERRPGWTFVMVGPVVKIDPASLPQNSNIKWLGRKSYEDLPGCLAEFDIALLPFALDDSTKFISPTKTPEYLAAGLPTISTPIADVVATYGAAGLVEIAGDADSFIKAAERIMAEDSMETSQRQADADRLLSGMSWKATWQAMHSLMQEKINISGTSWSVDSSLSGLNNQFDYVVVGAGFAGAVMAERLAAAGNRILVVDRRPHIGGNAYDEYDSAGIMIHRYGPHIFHTNSSDVFDYLSRFTEWRDYEHRVLAESNGKRVPMPINRTTINLLYDLELTEDQVQDFLAARAEHIEEIGSSEDVIISKVGRELYERFFRGYTRKQWGLDPKELDKSVIARIPVRTNDDDRYFSDKFQAMPLYGYTKMFERMLDHPNITCLLNTDYRDIVDEASTAETIYTGPIDEYFNCCYGALPYRSLKFQHETVDCTRFQNAAVINFPDEDIKYTRITEYKHLTGQIHSKTSISYEFPCADGDPYYPIPKPENQELYKRYQTLADNTPLVHFVGRLGTYRYYNMDQVVAQALKLFERLQAKTYVELRQASSPANV